MHIGIGAAILIVGLLWLATFRAGRIVLLTVALLGGGSFYAIDRMEQQDSVARHEAWVKANCNNNGGYLRIGCPGNELDKLKP
jgi:hypothetical protein